MNNTINLLANSARAKNIVDQFYVWAMGTGRYIVIVMEVIIIVGFIYKFKIDTDYKTLLYNFNLLDQRYSVVYPQEQAILKYNRKINVYLSSDKNQVKMTNRLNLVLESIPNYIVINQVNFTGNTIQFTGSVQTSQNSNTEINNLATTFKNNTSFSSVEINTLSSVLGQNYTSFSINLVYNG